VGPDGRQVMPGVRLESNATEMAEAYDRDVCLAAKAISLLQASISSYDSYLRGR
jgi:hypothetical protein